MEEIRELGRRAKLAASVLANAGSRAKQAALEEMAAALCAGTADIIKANELDCAAAEKAGMAPAMVDRLRLDAGRIQGIAEGVRQVAALADPIGEVLWGQTRPNGLHMRKVRVPMGVVGIIFEARPNVTVDAAALCFKAGNAAILRGGKEAIHSNLCLAKIMRETLMRAGLPVDAIQLVEDTSRDSANAMMKCGDLDVLIPRGGAGLIRAVVENATVPVIETGVGNCHIYVDAAADLAMATAIVENAKTQRPSVCNAAESLLVHSSVAESFLPMVQEKLAEHQVELVGCPRTIAILGDAVAPATEEDYATEFLGYKLSVKVVDSVEEAVEHIARYSTHHSEAIITDSVKAADYFTGHVDAAAVYVNASTRFTDGFEFGFGAEIGISTQKLHARGPMGLNELTTIKYIIEGNGQIR